MTRCPICGASSSSCGGPTTTHGIDWPPREALPMGQLKRYYVAGVRGRRAVWNLTAEQAERLGAEPVDAPSEPEAEPAPAKARKATTKTRKAVNK